MLGLTNEEIEEDEYNNIDYLLNQVRLVEIKVKYNDVKIDLLLNKEINKFKIADTIDIYEILIPYLKEKHLIAKIIEMKYDMENIKLQKKKDMIYEEYKYTCLKLGLNEYGEKKN